MSNSRIYDPIRKTYVLALPEEKVRQKLIHNMINELGFPKSLIAVEKDLLSLEHIKQKEFASKKRRADIICFAKDIDENYSIYPLLMIECKAFKLNSKTIDQVLGYNHYIKAFFVAIANEYEIITYWYNIKEKKYKSVNFLPSFNELRQMVIYAKY
ncbi:MAG: hypothetical protein K940chlam5_01247 [Candidatus Anoxychlamydiales bacterium]|nr:hypothetical protein [Candidatus Anoxychlamydiales bacterium]